MGAPPVVIPARDLEAMYGYSSDEIEEMIHQQVRAYRATLQEDRRHPARILGGSARQLPDGRGH